jgi:hypothetical protein
LVVALAGYPAFRVAAGQSRPPILVFESCSIPENMEGNAKERWVELCEQAAVYPTDQSGRTVQY